jgi:hypothetical protein
MAKSSQTAAPNSKGQKPAKGQKVIGATEDGVRILKPKGRATHFTASELEAAIANARATRSASGRDVFINCPFSPDYQIHFQAIVFTIVRSGFTPRCARARPQRRD